MVFLRVRKCDQGRGETHAPDSTISIPLPNLTHCIPATVVEAADVIYAPGLVESRHRRHASDLRLRLRAHPCEGSSGEHTREENAQEKTRSISRTSTRQRTVDRREMSTCRRWTWAHGGGVADRNNLQCDVDVTAVQCNRSALSVHVVTRPEVDWRAAEVMCAMQSRPRQDRVSRNKRFV